MFESEDDDKNDDVFEMILNASNDIPMTSQATLSQKSQSDNFEELVQVVAEIKVPDLKRSLKIHQKETKRILLFSKMLFKAANELDEKGVTLRLAVYQDIFRMFTEDPNLLSCSLMGFLMTEIYHLPTSAMAKIIEWILKIMLNFENNTVDERSMEPGNHPFALLPSALSRLITLSRGMIDPNERCREDLSSLDGSRYRDYVVDTLCEKPVWSTYENIVIVSTWADLAPAMPAKQTSKLLSKSISQLRNMQTNETLFLCDQLIRLLGCMPSIKNHALHLDHLNALIAAINSNESNRNALSNQGVFIAKFGLMINGNMGLGTDFAKSFVDATNVTHLHMSLLLSLMRIQRFEAIILKSFYTKLENLFRHELRAQKSKWYSSLPHYNEATFVNANTFRQIIRETIRAAASAGWDSVIHCCMTLGFDICHRVGKELVSFSVLEDTIPAELRRATDILSIGDSENRWIEHSMSELGVEILIECFECAKFVRAEILERTKIGFSVAYQDSIDVPLRFVKLLASIVNRASSEIPETMLKQVLDLVVQSQSSRIIFSLLQAIRPAICLRPGVVEHALQLFQRTLFQRNLHFRIASVAGMWTIATGYDNEAMQRNIIQCATRSLTHQYQVRAVFYRGMQALYLTTRYESVKTYIVEIFARHLNSVLQTPIQISTDGEDCTQPRNEQSHQFPILLEEKCLLREEIADPIAVLLNACQAIVASDKSVTMLSTMLDTIKSRIAAFDLKYISYFGDSRELNILGIEVCESMLQWHDPALNDKIWSLLCGIAARLKTTVIDDDALTKKPRNATATEPEDEANSSVIVEPKDIVSSWTNHQLLAICRDSGWSEGVKAHAWQNLVRNMQELLRIKKKSTDSAPSTIDLCRAFGYIDGGFRDWTIGFVREFGSLLISEFSNSDPTSIDANALIAFRHYVMLLCNNPVLLETIHFGDLVPVHHENMDHNTIVLQLMKFIRTVVYPKARAMRNHNETVRDVLQITKHLSRVSPQGVPEHESWLLEIVSAKPSKMILELALEQLFFGVYLLDLLNDGTDKMIAWSQLLLKHFGRNDDEDDEDSRENQENASPSVNGVENACVLPVETIDGKMEPFIFQSVLKLGDTIQEEIKWAMSEIPSTISKHEQMICARMHQMQRFILPIAKSELPHHKNTERFYLLLVRYYENLVKILKIKVSEKHDSIGDQGMALIRDTCQMIQSLHLVIQTEMQGSRAIPGCTRTIPTVVGLIEDYDIQLVNLSKQIADIDNVRCAIKINGFNLVRKGTRPKPTGGSSQSTNGSKKRKVSAT